jgi:hypothetical protein
MADEQTTPPHSRKPIVLAGYDWASLLSREGDALETQYRHILEHLGTQPGMLGGDLLCEHIGFREAVGVLQAAMELFGAIANELKD